MQFSVQWEPLALTRGTPIEVPEEGPVGRDGVVARFDHIGVHVTHVHEAVSADADPGRVAGARHPARHAGLPHHPDALGR